MKTNTHRAAHYRSYGHELIRATFAKRKRVRR